jgi:hypothetical protein
LLSNRRGAVLRDFDVDHFDITRAEVTQFIANGSGLIEPA